MYEDFLLSMRLSSTENIPMAAFSLLLSYTKPLALEYETIPLKDDFSACKSITLAKFDSRWHSLLVTLC